MTNLNPFPDLYLEANILLGLVWVLWITTKKIVTTLKIESDMSKQLLIARLLFLVLCVSPVLVRGLPSVSLEYIGTQKEFIENEIRVALKKSPVSSNLKTSRTDEIAYIQEPVEPVSRISGFSLQQVKWLHVLYFSLSVGFLIQIIRMSRQIIKLRQLINNCFLWKSIGKIHLMISKETWVPFSTSLFGKYQIVIPAAYITTPENLRVALAHEGQHIRNGDLLWEILMEGIKLMCYWNPAVYLWKVEFTRLREFACDEVLIGRKQISPYTYGNCLLQVAESLPSHQFLIAGTASMGLNSFFNRNDSSQLKRRIKMIVNQKNIRLSQLKAVILCGMLFLSTVLLSIGVMSGKIYGSSDPAYGQWIKHIIDDNLDGPAGLSVADMDGDRDLDVVVAGYEANEVLWYEAPSWTKHIIAGNLTWPGSLFVGKMFEGKIPDVVATQYHTGDILLYKAPSWSMHPVDNSGLGAQHVEVADMDGDNDLDVVAAGKESRVVRWYEAPSWNMHVIDSNLAGGRGLYLVDMNGDDVLDVVVAAMYANEVVWYEAPSWIKHTIDSDLWGAKSVIVADIDKDNDLDVVATGFDEHKVVFYQSPSWKKIVIDSNLKGAAWVYAADMDGDNDLDVVATGHRADAVVWYEAPTWTKHVIDSDLSGALYLSVSDIDSDNDLDVIANGFFAGEVVWYENTLKK